MKRLEGESEKEAIRCMEVAVTLTRRSLCHNAKCGTVIVKDSKVIGKGYNAPPLDKEENRVCGKELGLGKPRYDRTCCMHAEWRAVMDALKKNPEKLAGSKLYFTRVDGDGKTIRSGKPYCTVCSRMALDAGIGTFVLWHEEGICEYPTEEYNHLSYEYEE